MTPTYTSSIINNFFRAEEAEVRAHKTLMILKAKDEQVFELQQRIEELEKAAGRLEEVPPLDLSLVRYRPTV